MKGVVYLINIERSDCYKIGITKKTAEERLKALQTGNPFKLYLIDYFESDIYQKIETIIHRNFKGKKYIPSDFDNLMGEWFVLNYNDVKNFKKTCSIIEENIKFLQKNSSLDVTKY